MDGVAQNAIMAATLALLMALEKNHQTMKSVNQHVIVHQRVPDLLSRTNSIHIQTDAMYMEIFLLGIKVKSPTNGIHILIQNT